jgi:FG-GAP repeat
MAWARCVLIGCSAALAAGLAVAGCEGGRDRVLVLPGNGGGGGSAGGGSQTPSPLVTASLAEGTRLASGQVVTFTITVTHSGPVNLDLLNPPPGCVMSPARNAAAPLTRTVSWIVQASSHGRQQLLFRATDAVTSSVTGVLALDLVVQNESSAPSGRVGYLHGDVTGDGVLDVVAAARIADVGGVLNTGAIYVWRGGTALATGEPTFTLTVPGAAAFDRLGDSSGKGVQLADVTGDGVLDVVAGADFADVGGVMNAGAIYVWRGGAALAPGGPTVTLAVPGAAPLDLLGATSGQGVQFEDVTGDGVLDVVAGAHFADVGGVTDAGAIYVWRGGAALATGGLTATLTVPGAVFGDRLSFAVFQGVQLADVTGDGVADVVGGAQFADVAGVMDTGAIHVWRGGATLATGAPTVTLTVPGALASDQLGPPRFADVTGDGVLDLVAGSRVADVGGVTDAGAVYVWRGGPTLAAGAPTFTLTVPGASFLDQLGAASGQGVQLADVTGDSVLDVVVGAHLANEGGVNNSGAIYVWRGGATLTTGGPTFSLSVPSAVDPANLGQASGQGVQLVDVTGDGVLDVVAGAQHADVGGVTDTGAIYVWRGGASLTTGGPTLTLAVPGAVAMDQLGRGVGQVVQVADVTGDGVVDVVAGAQFADVGGVVDAGAIYVWRGGATLVSGGPGFTLTVPGAVLSDQLGFSSGQGVQLADVTGDGVLDVVATASRADVGGVVDAGAIYVWGGGAALATGGPAFTLTVPGAVAMDQLGSVSGQGVQLADVTGDGVLDVVGTAFQADVGGAVDTGGIYLWAGGAALATGGPSGTLSVPGAVAGDFLGFTQGQGVQLADVTGDGVLDVVAGAQSADVGGVVDTGAIYGWRGGAVPPTGGPTFTLSVLGAVAGDRLAGL